MKLIEVCDLETGVHSASTSVLAKIRSEAGIGKRRHFLVVTWPTNENIFKIK